MAKYKWSGALATLGRAKAADWPSDGIPPSAARVWSSLAPWTAIKSGGLDRMERHAGLVSSLYWTIRATASPLRSRNRFAS